MKTAFIIGGFNLHSTAADGVYPVIEQGLEKNGYNVISTGISWRRKTPSRYAEEFIGIYNKLKTEQNIIIGNSFGAVVGLLCLPKIDPDEAYLCSISPFFKEDREKFPDEYGIRYFGKQRMNDLWSYSVDALTKGIKGTKVHVLYGQKEHETSPNLVARCVDTAATIEGATLTEIAGAPHDMANEMYSKAVVREIKKNVF